LSVIVFFSINFSRIDMLLFLRNFCNMKYVLLAFFILSCHLVMKNNNKVWRTIRYYDWNVLLLSTHHSTTDITIQWVKNFLHARAEIQTTLVSKFCINKATKMVYITNHFGGVSYSSLPSGCYCCATSALPVCVWKTYMSLVRWWIFKCVWLNK
jgi:hypothetical protein